MTRSGRLDFIFFHFSEFFEKLLFCEIAPGARNPAPVSTGVNRFSVLLRLFLKNSLAWPARSDTG